VLFEGFTLPIAIGIKIFRQMCADYFILKLKSLADLGDLADFFLLIIWIMCFNLREIFFLSQIKQINYVLNKKSAKSAKSPRK
jgi:hypothetical protein